MQLYFAIYLREGSMTHEKTDGTKQRNGQPTLGPAVWKTAKGGKTADYNLICCHILTNDEKADKIFHVLKLMQRNSRFKKAAESL